MKFQRNDHLVFCAADARDLSYVQGVSEIVCRHWPGVPARGQMTDSDPVWRIAVGGRSGILGVCLDGRVSCVKLYHDARLRTRLRVAAGLAKGKRAYRNGLHLGKLGIPGAQMLGYAEQRPAGPALVIMELLDSGKRLDHWAAQCGVRRDVVLALARFLRDMHDRGVSHQDLSPRNLMIRPTEDGFQLLLLDYEDVRFSRTVRRATRLNDLHHLHERVARHVSLRDRLRFLREYVPQDYPAWRTELARRIGKSRSKYLRESPPLNGGRTP